MSLISTEGGSYRKRFGRWWLSGAHFWVGPFGLHLFWFDLHKSRFAYCSNWRDEAWTDQEKA